MWHCWLCFLLYQGGTESFSVLATCPRMFRTSRTRRVVQVATRVSFCDLAVPPFFVFLLGNSCLQTGQVIIVQSTHLQSRIEFDWAFMSFQKWRAWKTVVDFYVVLFLLSNFFLDLLWGWGFWGESHLSSCSPPSWPVEMQGGGAGPTALRTVIGLIAFMKPLVQFWLGTMSVETVRTCKMPVHFPLFSFIPFSPQNSLSISVLI